MSKKSLTEEIAAEEQAAQAAENAKQEAEEAKKAAAEKAKQEAEEAKKAAAEKAKQEAEEAKKANSTDKVRAERAKGIFKSYPTRDKLFFTSDHTAFFTLNAAENHAKTLKDTTVSKIER